VELYNELKRLIKERGLADAEVRACSSSCLDTCWAGPSICVEPDHYFYGRLGPQDLPRIVDALEQGSRLQQLVLTEDDFVMPERT
jgi:(2Fe-2S) ferredoxin